MPDNRRLRAFRKIELEPGETKTVTLEVNTNDLAFVGIDGKWRLEEGEFGIQIDTERIDISCTSTKIWNNPNR